AISCVSVAEGSLIVDNDELAARFDGVTSSGIVARTGIETRRAIASDESALSLAVAAARAALDDGKLTISDFDLLICSTCTPEYISPSMACLVLHELGKAELPAYDLSAACSGYLYALAAAYDHIMSYPRERVLVVTTEAMSRVVDPTDFETAILFGDAATAT